ncbi:hypothetical protein YPPY64_1718, partial [Yersinia pestis PY-64]
MAWAIL